MWENERPRLVMNGWLLLPDAERELVRSAIQRYSQDAAYRNEVNQRFQIPEDARRQHSLACTCCGIQYTGL
jgi:hypothetical protein